MANTTPQYEQVEYVANGGPLILLADYTPDFDPAPEPDLVAMHFGLDLRGNELGWVEDFTDHPFTAGIESFYYPAGSVLVEDPPPDTIELGFIDGQTAMGVLPFGFGQACINQVEALRRSGRLDSAVADQLIGAAITFMSIDRSVSEPACPCWSPEEMAALPTKKTDANCISDGSRLDIFQEGGCEHSFSVGIDSKGNLSCVTNRFDCPELPDLGGEIIGTNESEIKNRWNTMTSVVNQIYDQKYKGAGSNCPSIGDAAANEILICRFAAL